MSEPSQDTPPGLWAQIQEDWITHGRDWTLPGFRAMVMYRFGVWRMGIRNPLLRKPLSVLYRMMHRYVRNHYGIELHNTAKIGRRLLIAHQGAIVIHRRAVIGDDCIIRQGVTIGGASHERWHEAPTLGNRVHLGAGCMVLGKITIGDDARIGPNTVVTTDVPPHGRAVAPPPRVFVASAHTASEDSPDSVINE